jgi:PKD repeat protein
MKTVSRMLVGLSLLLVGLAAGSNASAPTLPVLWTAGGLDSGATSAGEGARIAADTAGNVAVVSGPAGLGAELAVTSYTPDGALRWRASVSPSSGRFRGDWVAAAPDGDFVAVGRNFTASGNPIAITLVRFTSNGVLAWRVDLPRLAPGVGRLLVDAAGNAYLAFNSVGDGQDIQVHKYSPAGVLLWSQVIGTGFMANDIARSLALSPDETDVVVTGDISGGSGWTTAAYNAATGARRWLVRAPDVTAARDVVVDATRVYVTGQSFTGEGTPALRYFLAVVAYDRVTGARLWRTDKTPADGSYAHGLRMALAPDGSLVVAGQVNRGFLDWYTVALETDGAVRWEAVRDGGLNTDEIPAAVLVTADGTTVVTGKGGPNLPGGFIPGVAAGYSPSGTLRWEAFARMVTAWATGLPSGDVCATGGYDALVTCWRLPQPGDNEPPTAVLSATPTIGAPPLTVTFDGSGSTDPDGTITSWAWSFGDGASATGPLTTHLYTVAGTYPASLTVTDDDGATSTATRSIIVGFPPAAPSGLTASIGGALVMLAWQDNSSDETAFHIERCAGGGCTSFSPLYVMPRDFTTFTDYTVAAGQSYGYRVRASNPAGFSPYSNIARAGAPGPPVPPTNLTATALARASIRLTWTNGTSSQTEVRIERCRGAGCSNFAEVASVAGSATSFTDTGLAARTTYRYRVRAYNALGGSEASNMASARTLR